MIIEINSDQIINNPFNPKNPFDSNEEKILDKSLEKWGLRGCLLVCEDYSKKGQYIAIDGNTRYKKVEGKIKVDVIENINNDNDLQQVTLDFCSAVKKRNFSALQRLYEFQKNHLGQEYKDVFEQIKVNIEQKQKEIKENTQFNKYVVLKFENEPAYLRYEQIVKSVKRKIKENDKLFKVIEEINFKDNIDLIEKYFMEVVMRIE